MYEDENEGYNDDQFPCYDKPVERQLGAGGSWFVFPCGPWYEAKVSFPVAGHQEQWICGEVLGLGSVEDRQDDWDRSKLSWLRENESGQLCDAMSLLLLEATQSSVQHGYITEAQLNVTFQITAIKNCLSHKSVLAYRRRAA